MAMKLVDDASLKSVADAIREKGGTSGDLVFPSGFVSAINAISGGGGDEAFSLRLLAQDEVAFDNFISTSATTVKTIKGYTYPLIDGTNPSFIVCLMVRRGAFVANEPAYAVGMISNFITVDGGPSFETSCTYKKEDGTFENTSRGYGAFPRTIHKTNGLAIGGRCNTKTPSINGTFDVYLYEIK